MLRILTPLEETRAYQELVGKEDKLGFQKEALALLNKPLRRRFGRPSRWASTRLHQADLKQLDAWAENTFDANDLKDLLDFKPD